MESKKLQAEKIKQKAEELRLRGESKQIDLMISRINKN